MKDPRDEAAPKSRILELDGNGSVQIWIAESCSFLNIVKRCIAIGPPHCSLSHAHWVYAV